MTLDLVLDYCAWGPFILTERMTKPWRLLAMVLWWPWFVVTFPVLFVGLIITTIREV